MKKIISLVAAGIMLGSLLAVSAFAYDPVNYEIPKAVTAPTIDGAFGDGEWDNALEIDMAASKINFVVEANPSLGEGSKYRFMWDDSALYYICVVDDGSVPEIVPAYGDALNSGDGVQFGIFGPTGGAAGDGTGHLFFTEHPKTDNGQPDCYEHFNIVDQIANDTYGAKIASTFQSDSAYTVEGSIPWSVFATIYSNGFSDEIKGVAGQVLRISCVIMDANGSDQSLAHNGGWFNFDETDIYTLVDTPAGYVPAADTKASGSSAFAPVYITEDTELWDDPDTVDLGGSGQPIQYMEAYGVGYSSLNDQVIFHDVDFGANGADKMYINFSFGAEDRDPATLAVYIDQKAGDPVATFSCGFTGGWESDFAQEFESACMVAPGVHTVIVEFTNESSGSFNYIRFNEAAPIVVETAAPETAAPAAEAAPAAAPAAAEAAPAAAPVAAAAPAAAAPAAQTGDVAAIAVLAAVAAIGTAVVVGKKR